MPKPSSRTVHAVMRALARAIDNLDLPAVEKIAEDSQEDPFEVLIANVAVRTMIKEGRTDQIRSVLQTGLREGSQTLERSLTQLVRAGLISEAEARNRSLNPGEILV